MQSITTVMEQMSPENREDFDKISHFIRTIESSVTEQRRETLLLSIGKEIVKYQAKGRTVPDLYGSDFEQFSRILLEDVAQRKPRTLKDKIKFYAMIPWAALTILFAMYTAMGLLNKWRSDNGGLVTISTSFLFMISAISLLLILVVTKFLNQPIDEEEATTPPVIKQFDIKALGTYIGIAVIFAGIGYLLSKWSPTFTLSPWGCLIVFLVGLGGFRVFFRFK